LLCPRLNIYISPLITDHIAAPPPMRATSVKSISSIVTSTTSWQPSLGGHFSDVAPVAASLKPDRSASSSPEPEENRGTASTAGPSLFQPPLPLRRSARIKQAREKPTEYKFNPPPINHKSRASTKAMRRKVCITLLHGSLLAHISAATPEACYQEDWACRKDLQGQDGCSKCLNVYFILYQP
jgi:hypothetical protein